MAQWIEVGLVARSRRGQAHLFTPIQAWLNPEPHDYLEALRIKYANWPPARRVLQGRIDYLLKRPFGRLPNETRRSQASFSYRTGRWTSRAGQLPSPNFIQTIFDAHVGFIVANMSRPAEDVVAFYNKRGTPEQWMMMAREPSGGRGCRAVRLPAANSPCVYQKK